MMNKVMKRHAVIFAALVGLNGGTVFGYTENIWQPVDGDWNGAYSDSRHWSLGHLPDCDKGEDAVFYTRDADYVVTIDVAIGDGVVPKPAFFKVGNDGKPAGLGWVKFIGDGKVNAKFKVMLYASQKASFGGSLEMAQSDISLAADASLCLCDDVNCGPYRSIAFADGASVELAGGAFDGKFSYPPGFERGRFIVSGGRFVSRGALSDARFKEMLEVSFTGGKIVAATESSVSDSRLLPSGGATLESWGVETSAMLFSSPAVICNGAFVATNAVKAGLHLGTNTIAHGGGRWTVGWFLPYGKDCEYVLGVDRIDMAGKYQTRSNVEYPGDTTLGSWGGGYSSSTYNLQSRFYGTATFDSRDAIDGVTGNAYSFLGIAGSIGGAYRFTGNGRAEIGFAPIPSYMQRIRAIEVDSGAQVTLRPDNRAILQVGAFRMGAGACFTFDPNIHSFDCLTSPEVAASARIVLDLTNLTDSTDGTSPSDASSGRVVRPVFFDTMGDGIPLANFELVNQPEGKAWTLRKFGGSVYLQDMNATLNNDSALANEYVWVGTAADNAVATGANWSCGVAPGVNEYKDLHFRFEGTNVVAFPSGGQKANQVTVGGKMHREGVFRRCGPPYRFTGGPLLLNRNANDVQSALLNHARLPLVVENDVQFRYDGGVILGMGPVVLEGAVAAPADASSSGLLRIGGDVRVAGSLAARVLGSLSDFALVDGRYPSLTVLPGGSVTAGEGTATATSFASPITLNTVGGGTMSFAAPVAFASPTALDHLVDGRLTFGDTLSLASEHTFCGTGRVDFAAVAASSATPPRLVLAGGVTAAVTELGGVDWTVRAGGKVTLMPQNDITTGRPLTVRPLGELTVDGDHCLTVAKPLAMGVAAKMVKKGAGTLALASGANTLAEASAIDVLSGAFAWTADLTIPRLAVAPGATLRAGAAALTVTESLSVDGATVVWAGPSSPGWTTLLTVADGVAIEGLPVGRNLEFRVRDLPSGGSELQVKAIKGLMVTIR